MEFQAPQASQRPVQRGCAAPQSWQMKEERARAMPESQKEGRPLCRKREGVSRKMFLKCSHLWIVWNFRAPAST
jgi:hypothetical protein